MRAIYAGTFDPITFGHLWVIREALNIFPNLTVAIGNNPNKKALFNVEERLAMIQASIPLTYEVPITHFPFIYLVDYATQQGATHIVRGIRNTDDLKAEQEFYDFNQERNPRIKTVFLMPPTEVRHISSSFVKQIIGPEGWKIEAAKLVPQPVLKELIAKFEKEI